MNMRVFFCAIAAAAVVSAAEPPDWTRFRGPNGSGISTATNVPIEFGQNKNLLWRLALPPGHSSPILHRDRIYLTAFRADALFTIAVDRLTGKLLWEREAPRVKTRIVDKRNNPASPSPAVEDNGVYVFFPDYGLIAYDGAGKERWTMPLGPFNNIYGMGASPVLVDDLLILACDQSVGSFLLAVEKRTGRVRWKVDRPEARSGHSTPILWRAPDGKEQLLLPGSFWRRHDLREWLWCAGQRSREQGHSARRRRSVENGGRGQKRPAFESRVPEVHACVLVSGCRSR
jgi:hypothetical protein